MEVNPNIAYAMLDRMLGGKGESFGEIRNLTEIETILIRSLLEKMLDSEEAWSSIVEIEPETSDFEVNPQFLQIIAPNETVIVISLKYKLVMQVA